VKGGRLHTVAYGNLCSAQLDPIEKKPLYHFLPRTPILSVAMGGCNLRCLNCQNWEISQARPADVKRLELLPEDLVTLAAQRGIRALAFTYSEPLVSFEYVRDAAGLARARGIRTVLVTTGFVEEGPLRELARVVDAVTLDVKSFRERAYREIAGARLAPVLRTLEVLREEGVWVEASFLMVTGLTDGADEVGRFAAWLARALGPGTPFHLLRFFPEHRLKARPPTPLAALEAARARALDAGLRFVYVGNVPGSDANHTRCPRCGRTLVERTGFVVGRFEIAGGRCPCGEVIPGVFS
jgi:pyruvate formate lyase activating enzyme